MPRGVLVGLCAGCRRAKGVDQGAQDPTRDRSQACFSRVIMLAFIPLQILPAALVRLCACVREVVSVRGRVRGRAYTHVCVRIHTSRIHTYIIRYMYMYSIYTYMMYSIHVQYIHIYYSTYVQFIHIYDV